MTRKYCSITKLSGEARDFLKKFVISFLGKEGPEEIVEAIFQKILTKLNRIKINRKETW